MTAGEQPLVTLAPMNDVAIEQLVQAATSGASANEVTPPLTEGDAWTEPRVAWLRDFHRQRRAGLNGPAGEPTETTETTWAVITHGQIVGSVRLKRSDEPGLLEAAIWLTRSARGNGIGRAAGVATLRRAAELGATAVYANTSVGNKAALAVLHQLGFTLAPAGDDGRIHAHRLLE